MAKDLERQTGVKLEIEGALKVALAKDAKASAIKVNASTRKALVAALTETLEDGSTRFLTDDRLDAGMDRVFDAIDKVRIPKMAEGRVRNTALIAVETGLLNGKNRKRWVVNSPNPRSSHRAMNGEVAKVGERFSNDMLGPGDIAYGGVGEVAGCTCTLEYSGPEMERGYTLNAGINALLLQNGGGKNFTAEEAP